MHKLFPHYPDGLRIVGDGYDLDRYPWIPKRLKRDGIDGREAIALINATSFCGTSIVLRRWMEKQPMIWMLGLMISKSIEVASGLIFQRSPTWSPRRLSFSRSMLKEWCAELPRIQPSLESGFLWRITLMTIWIRTSSELCLAICRRERYGSSQRVGDLPFPSSAPDVCDALLAGSHSHGFLPRSVRYFDDRSILSVGSLLRKAG